MTNNFEMNDSFKMNDLVEVSEWGDNIRRDWIIVGFASNGHEAIIRHATRNERSIIPVSRLKHQKKHVISDKYYKDNAI